MVITRQLTDSASASTASDIQLGSCVTEIGEGAFSGYSNIYDVEFPDSLLYIDNEAFRNCANLTSVTIPSGVTSIGNYAFRDCNNLTIITVEAATPPTLGGQALDYTNNCPIYVKSEVYDDYISSWDRYKDRICYNNMPYKVKFITDTGDTIIKCDSSTSIPSSLTIPNGVVSTLIGDCVTSIDNRAFYGKSLGNVVIPSNITSIGREAFMTASADSISFSEGLSSIGNYAFQLFHSTNSINLPNSLTSIGNYAFWQSSISSCTIGSGVTNIGNGVFSDCSGLTSCIIGNGVTSIGNEAFTYCTSLASINIPNSVTSIGSSAFTYCTSLTSCTIGSGVVSIGNRAFYNCKGVIRINATTPPTIQNNTFDVYGNQYNFIYVPQNSYDLYINAENWSKYANRIVYEGMNYKAMLFGEGEVVVCDGNPELSVGQKYRLTAVSIGDCVTSIGNNAFRYCDSLTSVEIPDSVTSIGDYAFEGLSGLTTINIPDSVTSFGSGIFSGCTSLNPVYNSDYFIYLSQYYEGSYTIPNGISKVHQGSFENCSGLTSVEMPDSVTSIGGYAFSGCTSLTSVTVRAATPPTLGGSVFPNSIVGIYVPSDSVDVYKAASGWRNYASRIQAIPNS